ncbi:MAG: arsenate reductase ArsC [Verrucomicrobiales bacterium]|nr:arsenate reductase ArsC [Verrucomicrobiales bacterium]
MKQGKRYTILFLCEGNSARSIFAEYLTRKIAPDEFEVFSAGSNPRGEVHPMTKRVLEEVHQVDASEARSKSWNELQGRDFDFVITVCDHSRNNCPTWSGDPVVLHWGSADPLAVTGDEQELFRVFKAVSIEIRRRVELFTSLPFDKLDRLRLELAGAEIGQENAECVA